MADAAPGCLICGERPLVKTHLLPAALMHDQRGEHKELHALAAGKEGFKRIQSGQWDRFLCARHEAVFNEADRYAVRFHRSFYDEAKLAGGGWLVPNPHPDRLRDFVFASVWRTLISFDGGRRLGPYEQQLRSHFFGNEKADLQMLAWRLNNVDPRGRETHVSVLPHRVRLGAVNCWAFSIAGIEWFLKADARAFEPELQRVVDFGENPICILNRDPVALNEDPYLKIFRNNRALARR